MSRQSVRQALLVTVPRPFSIRYGGLLGVSLGLMAIVCGCASTETATHVDLPPPLGTTPIEARGQIDDDDEGGGLLGFMDPARLAKKAKVAAGYGPNREIADRAFENGERLFVEASRAEGRQREGKFLDAAARYKKAADRWPESSIEEDALFMQCEAYFFADRYPEAAKVYEELVKKYPNTRHMDTIDQRRFAIAKYWIEHYEDDPDLPITPNVLGKDRPFFDKFGHAVRLFDKIRFDDPTGKLADDATMAAGLAHFKVEHYQRADELFADLRHSFPESEHQFQAHLLGLQCKIATYQGPQYSLTPMDEAEELLKQISRQFPDEVDEHREYLVKAWQEVRLKKAQHDFVMAEYYDKRKEFGAARQYYERVRDEYSDTSLAQEATEALSHIADAPAKPDQPLPWLANMFPTPDREKPLVARNPFESLRR